MLISGECNQYCKKIMKNSFDDIRLLSKATFLFDISQFVLDHFKVHFVSKFWDVKSAVYLFV